MLTFIQNYLIAKYGSIPRVTVVDQVAYDTFVVHFANKSKRHIKINLEVLATVSK